MQKAVKSQSAMEYLMTYGWAILAIAIVMVSLYSLGIFNLGSLQPTATPGSCQVLRTGGQTSLAGQCSNLLPKYVVTVARANSQYIKATTTTGLPLGAKPFTMSVWVKTPTSGANMVIAQFGTATTYGSAHIWDDNGNHVNVGFYGDNYISSSTVNDGKWHNIVFVYNGSTTSVIGYVDNVQFTGTVSAAGNIQSGNVLIGYDDSGLNDYWNGQIANLQIYNISFDATQVKALYTEGIGGSPINPQNIVGWWPLNGNDNDYSGNDNQGVANGAIVWTASWQAGYTAPTS
ncbi:MAG: LamG domain-containing protein [Candidatus Micrarchaeota archaeon]|nr:LamG domain-containing protein [Candidatus Micrarchaeota archaeon]